MDETDDDKSIIIEDVSVADNSGISIIDVDKTNNSGTAGIADIDKIGR